MISKEQILKLQSHLDGELSAADAAEVARLLESDAEASALHNEMRMLGEVLRTNEAIVPVPESRDFYWSKIAKGIDQAERDSAPAAKVSPWAWLSRWAVPVGSAAALVALMLTITGGNSFFITEAKRMSLRREIDSPVEDTSVVEFHDAKTGVTVVWIASEPDND